LSELESRYRDAQIDGRYGVARFSASLPIQTSPEAPGKSSRPRGTRSFSYVASDGREKLHLASTTPFDQLKDPKRYIDSVVVSAGSHQFTVSRHAPGEPYFLTGSEMGTVPSIFQLYRGRVKNAAYCPAGFSDFPEYANSQQFKITEVSHIFDSGRPVTTVVFEYLPNGGNKPQIKGWIRLDTAMNWIIRDYEITVTNTQPDKSTVVSSLSGSITYKQEKGTPIPVRVRCDQSQDNNVQKKRFYTAELFEIDRFELGRVPPGDFSLAAFGLGDFEQPSARGANRVPYYLIFGALIALFLSAVLAKIARSFKRKDARSATVGSSS
jgi:hypothetical protein